MITKKKKSDAQSFINKQVGQELTFGALLLAIRQGEELSQVQFANLLKVSKQYLCDLEHGRKSVSPKVAANFAKKLGYSEQQFVRLCLQDIVNRAGLKLKIDVAKAASFRAIDASQITIHDKKLPNRMS